MILINLPVEFRTCQLIRHHMLPACILTDPPCWDRDVGGCGAGHAIERTALAGPAHTHMSAVGVSGDRSPHLIV